MTQDINKEQIQLAYLIWFFILGTLIYSNFFNPTIKANELAVFGSNPYGIPLAIFMSILQTLVLVPMIPVLKHFTVLIIKARGQGSGLKLFSILSHAVRDPNSKRGLVICVVGFIYFLVLMYFWATYIAPSTK